MVEELFIECVNAIEKNVLIERANSFDKEFHFQNWVNDRLEMIGKNFDAPGRNSFPDFAMVDFPLGFEVKGLAYPGRDKTYDGNSQVPKGDHNGRTIYYIFGRYPKNPDGNKYPVLDLIICPGSFLNADSNYKHKNKSARGFGSYGDIMIRDRKMYVIPTPFSLAEGLAHNCTLILPQEKILKKPFICVGDLIRAECELLLTSYHFNLLNNELSVTTEPNPNAGRQHWFKAWRLSRQGGDKVKMRSLKEIIADLENVPDENE